MPGIKSRYIFLRLGEPDCDKSQFLSKSRLLEHEPTTSGGIRSDPDSL